VATTLALPATPAAPSAILGASRSVVIGWTDTSDDETGFQIERASALAGPYSVVATAAANTTSATDTTAPQALTFFYRVVTQRGADLSLPSASVSLTTPAFATSPTAPTGVAASSGTQVAVSWGDRSTNETGFQVYRRIGTGTFSAVSGVLPANTTTYTDTTTTPGTSYNYRVDVSNWAGVVQSGISAAITTPVPVTVSLSAPAGLAISAARPPVLSWTDTATGETAYRVRRSTVTMNANGSISQSAATTLSSTLAAGTSSYSDLTATASAVYLYDVAAMNGATVGALASGYTVAATGGLTAPSGVTLTRALVGTAAQVTVRWTLATPNTAVGGFEIQRCVGATCTTFAKVSGSAVNTAGTVDGRATLSFVNTGLARATTYSYRVRSVGGGNTGLTSAFTARSTVTTQ
jgi:titin